MIESIDEIIPFSNRHKGETIRMIIRYDSGYLKDLFLRDDRLYFSQKCFSEICRLTRGHFDNWEKPTNNHGSIFAGLKRYAKPYLYDFNDESLRLLNEERLLNKTN